VTAGPDGVLVVDKSDGPTSHDVVAVARRALATSRVGHTGTLDPMATGVLVLVVGRATRLARYMAGDVKEYLAGVTFGRDTDSFDARGAVTRETGLAPERESLVAALAHLAAQPTQRPPAFSAKKVDGEVAYAAARRHAPLVLAPVPVVVHQLTLLGYEHGVAHLSMRVSAGFYVRSLAHDLGEALGTGAHLSALRRTRAGAFDLAGAVTFEALKAAPRGSAAPWLRPLESLLTDRPAAVLAPEAVSRVRHGQTVQGTVCGAAAPDEAIRLLDDDGRLVAVARAATDGPAPAAGRPVALRPVVVLG
jgi:tRNA pseudouridine55 synthase